MKLFVTALQIFFSLGLIVLVLLQARGTGLSAAWGGSGESFRSKRGLEKLFFILTIIFAALFCLTSYLNLFTQ